MDAFQTQNGTYYSIKAHQAILILSNVIDRLKQSIINAHGFSGFGILTISWDPCPWPIEVQKQMLMAPVSLHPFAPPGLPTPTDRFHLQQQQQQPRQKAPRSSASHDTKRLLSTSLHVPSSLAFKAPSSFDNQERGHSACVQDTVFAEKTPSLANNNFEKMLEELRGTHESLGNSVQKLTRNQGDVLKTPKMISMLMKTMTEMKCMKQSIDKFSNQISSVPPTPAPIDIQQSNSQRDVKIETDASNTTTVSAAASSSSFVAKNHNRKSPVHFPSPIIAATGSDNVQKRSSAALTGFKRAGSCFKRRRAISENVRDNNTRLIDPKQNMNLSSDVLDQSIKPKHFANIEKELQIDVQMLSAVFTYYVEEQEKRRARLAMEDCPIPAGFFGKLEFWSSRPTFQYATDTAILEYCRREAEEFLVLPWEESDTAVCRNRQSLFFFLLSQLFDDEKYTRTIRQDISFVQLYTDQDPERYFQNVINFLELSKWKKVIEYVHLQDDLMKNPKMQDKDGNLSAMEMELLRNRKEKNCDIPRYALSPKFQRRMMYHKEKALTSTKSAFMVAVYEMFEKKCQTGIDGNELHPISVLSVDFDFILSCPPEMIDTKEWEFFELFFRNTN